MPNARSPQLLSLLVIVFMIIEYRACIIPAKMKNVWFPLNHFLFFAKSKLPFEI